MTETPKPTTIIEVFPTEGGTEVAHRMCRCKVHYAIDKCSRIGIQLFIFDPIMRHLVLCLQYLRLPLTLMTSSFCLPARCFS
jgi:hypothetical protein